MQELCQTRSFLLGNSISNCNTHIFRQNVGTEGKELCSLFYYDSDLKLFLCAQLKRSVTDVLTVYLDIKNDI